MIKSFSMAISACEEKKIPSLLGKLARLTTIREIELFEYDLLKGMAELLKIQHITLYKLDQSGSKCNSMIYSAQHTVDDVRKHLTESKGVCAVEIDTPEEIKAAQFWIGRTGKPYVNNQGSNYSVVYPIVNGEQVEMLLTFELPYPLTDDEMSIITSLLDIAHNYHNLLNENQKDKLTGLLNRHTFEESILRIQSLSLNSGSQPNQAWRGENRRKEKNELQQYCLAIIDIDNFKRVNDHYGHIIGDEVLLLLSYMLKQNFRAKDLLFRFGGEEFVVIFLVRDKENAHIALERFREIVEQYSFPQVKKITVSIGATLIKECNQRVTDIIGDADKAMYYAKTHGRNQIHFYDDLVACGQLVESTEAEIADFLENKSTIVGSGHSPA